MERANVTKSKMGPTGSLSIPAPLWEKGADFQVEGWTERFSWQTEREWLESSSLERQGEADGAGDEEMQRGKQLWEMQGERTEISALQVKTK